MDLLIDLGLRSRPKLVIFRDGIMATTTQNPVTKRGEKSMVLVAVAWIYVVLMVAVVEATSSSGTLMGAGFTFLLYGLLPLGIVAFLALSPARRRARRAAEFNASRPPSETSSAPNDSGHAARDSVTAEGEKP
jgi:hypothetical protein